MRLMILSIVVALVSLSCKQRTANGSRVAGAEKPVLNVHQMIDKTMDWGIVDAKNNIYRAVRELKYCVTEVALQQFGGAFDFAAERLNNNLQGRGKWQLVPSGDITCPNDTSKIQIIVDARDLQPLTRMPGGVGDVIPVDAQYDQAGAAAGNAAPPRGVLAYFQAASAEKIGSMQVIEQGRVVFNMNATIQWDTTVKSAAFDPYLVAMHEIGHAVRLDHLDPVQFPLTQSKQGIVVGAAANASDIIVQAADAQQTVGDDIAKDNGDGSSQITDGGNGVADSGIMQAIMAPNIAFGQHGINPVGTVDTERYNYSSFEIGAMAASAAEAP